MNSDSILVANAMLANLTMYAKVARIFYRQALRTRNDLDSYGVPHPYSTLINDITADGPGDKLTKFEVELMLDTLSFANAIIPDVPTNPLTTSLQFPASLPIPISTTEARILDNFTIPDLLTDPLTTSAQFPASLSLAISTTDAGNLDNAIFSDLLSNPLTTPQLPSNLPLAFSTTESGILDNSTIPDQVTNALTTSPQFQAIHPLQAPTQPQVSVNPKVPTQSYPPMKLQAPANSQAPTDAQAPANPQAPIQPPATIQPEAKRKTRASGRKWTQTEKEIATQIMQDIDAKGLFQNDKEKSKLWEHVSEELRRHGYERQPLGIRMFWNRQGRAESGFDERSPNRVHDKGQMAVCVQRQKSRKRKRKGER